MLRIHKELWYARKTKEEGKDKDLAYMTHTDKTKAFEKRQNTGRGWAEGYQGSKDNYEEYTVANTPLSGFTIAECVSRYKTANKLFRIRDPRGFVVEIPSANLLELLLVSQVNKGVVMEPCIWGRDGSNHYLLPVSDEEYQATLGRESQRTEMVTFAKLNVSDVVKFSVEDDEEYVYLGRTKTSFHVKTFQKEVLHPHGYSYRDNSPIYKEGNLKTDKLISDGIEEDDKWNFMFQHVGKGKYKSRKAGKCVPTGEKGLVPQLINFTLENLNHPDISWFEMKYKITRAHSATHHIKTLEGVAFK